jgi:hypothetical protein
MEAGGHRGAFEASRAERNLVGLFSRPENALVTMVSSGAV